MWIRRILMLSWAMFAVLACTRVERRSALPAEAAAHAGARAPRPESQPQEEPAEQGSSSSRRPTMPAAVGGSSTPPAAARAPEIGIATVADCELIAPEAPATECFDFDPAEPNDLEHPATLPLDTGCGYLEANISAGDEDAFAFTTLRSDPVLIELSYWGSGEADLEQSIYSPTGSLLTEKRTTRKGQGEDLRSVIHSAADGSYVLRVRDSNNTRSCQSYALRVDPLYCSDDYEDNDSLAAAAKLLWNTDERVALSGTVLADDEDFFEVTTVRADPVHLTGYYTAGATSTVQVARAIYDGAGSLQNNFSGKRETDTEMFSHWMHAPSKGSVLRTRLSATGSGCASYELTMDGAACTDAFEDNDSATEAAKLDAGVDVDVSIYRTDEDHYAVPPLVGGSCELSYDIPSGRTQQLQLAVYDGAGSMVTSKAGGELTGTTRSLKVSWTTSEVRRVKVTASDGGYCQLYRLRCDAAPRQ